MKFKCCSCGAILSIKKILNEKYDYKKVIVKDVFNCPVCGDMMLYKPNIKRGG